MIEDQILKSARQVRMRESNLRLETPTLNGDRIYLLSWDNGFCWILTQRITCWWELKSTQFVKTREDSYLCREYIFCIFKTLTLISRLQYNPEYLSPSFKSLQQAGGTAQAAQKMLILQYVVNMMRDQIMNDAANSHNNTC